MVLPSTRYAHGPTYHPNMDPEFRHAQLHASIPHMCLQYDLCTVLSLCLHYYLCAVLSREIGRYIGSACWCVKGLGRLARRACARRRSFAKLVLLPVPAAAVNWNPCGALTLSLFALASKGLLPEAA